MIGPAIILPLVAIYVALRRLERSRARACNDPNSASTHEYGNLEPWAKPSAGCLNAYIRREYAVCASAGQATLAIDFIPIVGLVTILALRRLGLGDTAEDLGRNLLLRNFGPDGMFLMFMRVLDGDLEPERFLQNLDGHGDATVINPDIECQVYFYWGAKLLTEGKFTEAMRPLLLSVATESDTLERSLADADLKTASENLPSTEE